MYISNARFPYTFFPAHTVNCTRVGVSKSQASDRAPSGTDCMFPTHTVCVASSMHCTSSTDCMLPTHTVCVASSVQCSCRDVSDSLASDRVRSSTDCILPTHTGCRFPSNRHCTRGEVGDNRASDRTRRSTDRILPKHIDSMVTLQPALYPLSRGRPAQTALSVYDVQMSTLHWVMSKRRELYTSTLKLCQVMSATP